MARPRDPTALSKAKGKAHRTKAEYAERESREVYASDGKIKAPDWLDGVALDHFEKNAAYMMEVNRLAKRNVYGSTDVEQLAMMSISFQRSTEHLLAEETAKLEGSSDRLAAAQKNRLAEDRNYREFMKLLKLDPGSRVDVNPRGAGDVDGGSVDNLL